MKSKINQLVDILKGHRVLIQTHNCPDPDAMASAYGLQYLLKAKGIESRLVYDGVISKFSDLRMIDYANMEIFYAGDLDLSDDEYIVVVDAQKYNENCTDLTGDEVACIDHHPTVIECEYQFKDIRMVGACSSIIAEYIIEAGIEFEPIVATLLLYGIKMDTLDFTRGVTELDAKMYYMLFRYADHEFLAQMQVNQIDFKDLKAYGAAIDNISLYKDIGYACIPFDCPNGLIAIISDFILALEQVTFSVVYAVRKEGYKFSIRSERDDLDAGRIVRKALQQRGMSGNGGGHSFMAGGFLPVEEIEKLGTDPRKELEKIFDSIIYPGDEDYEKNTVYIKTAN